MSIQTHKILRNYKGGEELLYDSIRSLCKEKGVAVSKMETDLGFPRSSICKWNENEPGIRKVQKVADYLQVSIEKLLQDHDSVVQKQNTAGSVQ